MRWYNIANQSKKNECVIDLHSKGVTLEKQTKEKNPQENRVFSLKTGFGYNINHHRYKQQLHSDTQKILGCRKIIKEKNRIRDGISKTHIKKQVARSVIGRFNSGYSHIGPDQSLPTLIDRLDASSKLCQKAERSVTYVYLNELSCLLARPLPLLLQFDS